MFERNKLFMHIYFVSFLRRLWFFFRTRSLIYVEVIVIVKNEIIIDYWMSVETVACMRNQRDFN